LGDCRKEFEGREIAKEKKNKDNAETQSTRSQHRGTAERREGNVEEKTQEDEDNEEKTDTACGALRD
jgi:hypothetical protein